MGDIDVLEMRGCLWWIFFSYRSDMLDAEQGRAGSAVVLRNLYCENKTCLCSIDQLFRVRYNGE